MGLVIVIQQQFSRQHVIDMLNRLGYTELAEEASRVLPDPVDMDQLEALGIQHGLTRDDLISRMGGSPEPRSSLRLPGPAVRPAQKVRP
jgi:hypothetical protein